MRQPHRPPSLALSACSPGSKFALASRAIRSARSKTTALTSLNLQSNLLDNLTTAVIVLDERLRVFHINPAAEDLLETSDRHCRHAYIGDLLLLNEQIKDAMRQVQRKRHTFIAR